MSLTNNTDVCAALKAASLDAFADAAAVGNTICSQENCGDAIIGMNEECDDDNQSEGDGCSAICEVEPPCSDSDGNGVCDSDADSEDNYTCPQDCFVTDYDGEHILFDDAQLLF